MAINLTSPWSDLDEILGFSIDTSDPDLPETMQIWPINGHRSEHDRAVGILIKLCCPGNKASKELLGHDTAILTLACSTLSGCDVDLVVTLFPRKEEVKVWYHHAGKKPVEKIFSLNPGSHFLYRFAEFANDTALWYELIGKIKGSDGAITLDEDSTPPSLMTVDRKNDSCIKVKSSYYYPSVPICYAESEPLDYNDLLKRLELSDGKMRAERLRDWLDQVAPDTYEVRINDFDITIWRCQKDKDNPIVFKTTGTFNRKSLREVAKRLIDDITSISDKTPDDTP